MTVIRKNKHRQTDTVWEKAECLNDQVGGTCRKHLAWVTFHSK